MNNRYYKGMWWKCSGNSLNAASILKPFLIGREIKFIESAICNDFKYRGKVCWKIRDSESSNQDVKPYFVDKVLFDVSIDGSVIIIDVRDNDKMKIV